MNNDDLNAIDPATSRFVAGLVEDYFNARTPVLAHSRISRGVSRVVSSLAEERLAHWLVETFGNRIEHIYIDQDLWVGKKHLCRPDLVLTSRASGEGAATIRMLIDVKMDLGYCRDGLMGAVSETVEDSKVAGGLVGKACRMLDLVLIEGHEGVEVSSVGRRNRKVKDGQKIRFSADCSYVFFIISGLNIGVQKRRELECRINRCFAHAPVIKMVTMFPHCHANDRGHGDKKAAEKELLNDLASGTFSDFRRLVTYAVGNR